MNLVLQYNSDKLFRFERERAKLTDTVKLLEQGLTETQAEVDTLKTSNEEMTNKITDVCGEENLSDIKKTLAGNFRIGMVPERLNKMFVQKISTFWMVWFAVFSASNVLSMSLMTMKIST